MNYGKLSHTKWECKYHIVFIPKYRRRVLYGDIRRFLGPIFHELAGHRESEILEGHMMSDHVHMLISIPPKSSISSVMGYIKGKSALYIAREYSGARRLSGQSFWARGYFVSTVGRDETVIREYIRNQEKEDKRTDQPNLFRA